MSFLVESYYELETMRLLAYFMSPRSFGEFGVYGLTTLPLRDGTDFL